MAELDRFEKTFRPGWRAAYNYARGGVASLDEIADKLIKTLAKTLRENSGVPGLQQMAEIVNGTGDGSLLQRFSALDDIVRLEDGHRHCKIAAEVAKSFLVQQAAYGKRLTSAESDIQFPKAVCGALVDHYYFANARQHLVTEGKVGNYEEARKWQAQLEDKAQAAMGGIAEQLVQNSRADTLRAPKANGRQGTNKRSSR